MRITNSMTVRNYKSQLNALESRVSKSLMQSSSGNALENFSDDTSAAIRAYKIRYSQSKVTSYQSNISTASSSLTDSESALMTIEDIYQYAMEKIVQAQNSTNSEDERSTIATELRSLQEELLSTLNTSVSGSYIFGGTTTSTEPFTLDDDGNLVYNGATLADLDATDATDAETISSLKSDERYLNIGLNLSFDNNGDLVTSSAFSYTISGISIMGYGTTTATVDSTDVSISNNLYDLLGQIADTLESSDYSYDLVDSMYSQFEESYSGISQSLTTVGAKQNYLTFMKTRYTTQTQNLTEAQSEVEDVDLATALIMYKTNVVALEAALQMSSNVIQNSIFDYMS